MHRRYKYLYYSPPIPSVRTTAGYDPVQTYEETPRRGVPACDAAGEAPSAEVAESSDAPAAGSTLAIATNSRHHRWHSAGLLSSSRLSNRHTSDLAHLNPMPIERPVEVERGAD